MRSRRRDAVAGAVSLGLLGSLGAARSDAGLVQRTIAIDGEVLDWAPILVSPQNYVSDPSVEQGDPDMPTSSDRDLRAFAVTWDADNLYFYFRRTFAGNNAITYLVYVDLDHDFDLDGNDRLIRMDFNGTSPQQRELRVYAPAAGADPITGDGVNEPGEAGALMASTMSSAANPNGIEIEASIAWTDLFADPADHGKPLNLRAAVSAGMNLPGHLRDNSDPIDTQYGDVLLESDGWGGGPSPSMARFAHRLTNLGNGFDRFDLSVTSANGWATTLWSDPDGDGDPADGLMLGYDDNGDGDYGDPLDIVAGWADTNGNGLPDTDRIAPRGGGVFDVVVDLTLPAGVANGAEDLLEVRARSDRDLAVTTLSEDLVAVGDRLISPSRERATAAGSHADAPHQVCNFGVEADVIDLTPSTTLGWSVELWSDPDGDGDPIDGSPLTDSDADGLLDLGPLAPGACAGGVARIFAPPGAALGTREQVTVTAASSVGPESDIAEDGVAVVRPVAIEPDHVHFALPGEVLFAPLVSQNGGTAADIFDLGHTSTQGSTVAYASDPDCDGLIDDGRPIAATDLLEPFGGEECQIAEIVVPATVPVGAIETVTTTATSQWSPIANDLALDIIEIVHVRTYANPLYTLPSATFYRCGAVYAAAGGLTPGTAYRFVWSDPDSTDGPERISPNLLAESTGRVDDDYDIGLDDVPGRWVVRIQEKSGSSWLDVTPLGAFVFDVLDESSGAGEIDALSTERIGYAVTGDTVRVKAEIENRSPIYFYRDTTLTYTLFQDQDGDGQPDVLEPFIQSDGTHSLWWSGALTHEAKAVSVFPHQRLFDAWEVVNVQFQTPDVWTLHFTWRTPCGTLVDEGSVDLVVGCAAGPVADAGADVGLCAGGGVTLGAAPEPLTTYDWSPSLGLDDPTSSQPFANPASTTTYSVTASNVETGCSSTDDVVVAVYPTPVANAGGDQTSCPGELVVIGTPAIVGYSYRWTPTTGLSQPFSAQTTAVVQGTTTYVLEVTDASSGCVATDQVTVDLHGLVYSNSQMGNVLMATRSADDVIHHWTDRGGMDGYELRWSSSADMVGAAVMGQVAPGLESLTEAGAILDGQPRFYRLSGLECAAPSGVP